MAPQDRADPLPPEPQWSSASTAVFAWAQRQRPATQEPPGQGLAEAQAQCQRLEQELAAAHAELAAMENLLEQVSEIFEGKFRQRLQPLLNENTNLRRQLQQLQARSEPGPPPLLLPAAQPPRHRRGLRHAFGLPLARPQGRSSEEPAEAA